MMIQGKKGLQRNNRTIVFNTGYLHNKIIIREQQKQQQKGRRIACSQYTQQAPLVFNNYNKVLAPQVSILLTLSCA